MEKFFLFALLALYPMSRISAQKAAGNHPFYIRAGVGYSFPLGGTYTFFQGLPVNGTAVILANNNSDRTIELNLKKASFGAGTTGIAGLVYMFTRHIGIDLSVGLGLSMKKYKYKESSPADVEDYAVTRITYAKMPVLVMPSIIMSTGGENVIGYTRVGLTIAVAGKFIIEDDISYFPSTVIQVAEVKNKLALGFTSAAGIKYKLMDRFAIWMEANALFMDIKAKSAKAIRYDVNGISRLEQLTVAQRETEYSEEYIHTNPNANTNKPHTEIPISAPLNNWGIAIGVNIEM